MGFASVSQPRPQATAKRLASLWLIGDFLGCSVDVVVERYGCDEMYTSHQAANTLAHGNKQKAGQRRLREQGLRAA